METNLTLEQIEQAAAAVITKRENVPRAAREGDLGHPAVVLRAAHDHRGLGIADEVFDLRALIGRVERQIDKTCAQGRQIKDQGLDRLFHLHRDPRTLGQFERGQQVGHQLALKPQPLRDPFGKARHRQRGEQHHRALGEVEDARCLEDQHEAQRHQRVQHAGHQAADQGFQKEGHVLSLLSGWCRGRR